MQSGIERTSVASAALHALGVLIDAELARVLASLRDHACAPAASDPVWMIELLQSLAEVEGALAHAGQPGLRALLRLLRRQLAGIEEPLAASPTDLLDAVQSVARTVKLAFAHLLQGSEVDVAELTPCWQQLAALQRTVDASPSELLSLRPVSGSLPPLPALPCDDPLAQAEQALLACLRADDANGRAAAVRALATVLAAVAAQAPTAHECACWRILHAHVLELVHENGPLQVRDKKMLAAIIRVLRHRDRGEFTAGLESLAREAMLALSSQHRQTDAGKTIADLFQIDRQCAGLTSARPGPSSQACAHSLVAAVVAREIAAAESDTARIHQPALWQALADPAAQVPGAAALAELFARLGAALAEGEHATRDDCLAALLLAVQAWADGGDDVGSDGAADRLAAVFDQAGQPDSAVAMQALFQWMRQHARHRQLAVLCDILCAELAMVESSFEVASQGVETVSALAAADEVLRQVAGALALVGITDPIDAVAALRSLLGDIASTAHPTPELMQSLATAWVQLAATLALHPVAMPGASHVPQVDADASPATTSEADARERLKAIFIDEAGSHLRYLHRLAEDGCNLSDTDALRAAHTIAGCSATIGQTAIADLAAALEAYLMVEPCPADPVLLGETLNALSRMLDDFTMRGQCDVQSVLLRRLQAETEPAVSRTATGNDTQSLAACTTPAAPADDSACALVADEIGGADAGAMPATLLALPAPEPAAGPVAADSAITPPATLVRPAGIVRCGDGGSAELQAIFEQEAGDLILQLALALSRWQQQPDSREPSMQLLRVLHTLKGSARMAGLHALGDEFHQAEAEIAMLAQRSPAELLQALPALQARVDCWALNPVPAAAQPDDALSVLASCATNASAVTTLASPAHHADDGHDLIPPDALPAASPAARPVPAAPQLRVAAAQLARAADAAATLSIGNASIHDAVQEQRRAVAAMAGDLVRLRSQLRELEIESESRILSQPGQAHQAGFDPLEFDRYTSLHELTRMMAESIGDLAGAQRGLARQIERLASSAAVQARDMRQLQRDLQAMQSQPLRVVEARLRLLLRQVVRDTGNQAELALTGAEVGIERSLLDRLIGPFGHLLRNAVVHGIEPAEQRVASGKPPVGTVTIGAALAANELRLWVHDDGRGLDLACLRSRALAAGLLRPDDAPDDKALAALIFAPGFSTVAEVTPWSGRGIGMDAVRAELQALGGRIAVDSAPGQGCRFTMSVPLALASLSVLLVSAGTRRVALPVAQVRQVVQPAPGDIDRTAGNWQIRWQGHMLPLRDLGHALGAVLDARAGDARLPVAIVQDGEHLLALQLDAVHGQRDVMVKHPGPQLAQVPGITGATVLGDGSIVLIVDPLRMPATPTLPAEHAPERPLVLVVDDSLTVRRATQRLLEQHGYTVALARDGIEALERLGERRPVALLLDIEMPRMDGFELLTALRADARLASLPVVMITSRIADRHRARAQQLGVVAYLGKPFDEQLLLAQLMHLRSSTPLAA